MNVIHILYVLLLHAVLIITFPQTVEWIFEFDSASLFVRRNSTEFTWSSDDVDIADLWSVDEFMLISGWMAVSTCRCLRWAFNIAAWEPSQTEWMLAVQSIQHEELEKANGFYFRNDIKAAVVSHVQS